MGVHTISDLLCICKSMYGVPMYVCMYVWGYEYIHPYRVVVFSLFSLFFLCIHRARPMINPVPDILLLANV